MSEVKQQNWIILVSDEKLATWFYGLESEAERVRLLKETWSGEKVFKRLPDANELATGRADNCLNHQNFKHVQEGVYYNCERCRC